MSMDGKLMIQPSGFGSSVRDRCQSLIRAFGNVNEGRLSVTYTVAVEDVAAKKTNTGIRLNRTTRRDDFVCL
jgi:hypothetical protein